MNRKSLECIPLVLVLVRWGEVLTVESEFIGRETVCKLGLLLIALQWDEGLGVSGSEVFPWTP